MSEWRTLSSMDAVLRRSISMKTTRPRSAATLRWRLAISSRNGTMTVHPERAVIINATSSYYIP